MRIGIITFHNAKNFGAALQAYALYSHFRERGCSVKIINYRMSKIEEHYALLFKPGLYIAALKKSPFHFFYRITRSFLEFPYKIIKNRRFLNFENSFFDLTKECMDYNDLVELGKNFDVIVCGSDQIWNPNHTGGFKKEFFGAAWEGKLVMSYAASMGEYCLKEDELVTFSGLLSHVDKISVREISTMNNCENVSDRKITLVADPTILLDKSQWISLIVPPKVKKKYILVYDLNKDQAVKSMAQYLSKIKGLDVIELETSSFFSGKYSKRNYSAGPQEFLGWINGAEYVVTSSYHGTIFSIIFNKKFYASDKTRISDLLLRLNLKSRLLIGSHDDRSNFEESIIDYAYIKEILSAMADTSKEFISDALRK